MARLNASHLVPSSRQHELGDEPAKTELVERIEVGRGKLTRSILAQARELDAVAKVTVSYVEATAEDTGLDSDDDDE